MNIYCKLFDYESNTIVSGNSLCRITSLEISHYLITRKLCVIYWCIGLPSWGYGVPLDATPLNYYEYFVHTEQKDSVLSC